MARRIPVSSPRPRTYPILRVVAATLLMLPALAGCTSMLVGGSGASAGRPIGADDRAAADVAEDERITRAIRDRYAADPDLQQAGLMVESRQGTVTLRGTVTDFEHRDRAVRLAGDVRGVVRVHNRISVRSR